jgi:outer membrane protein assembly factor BamA
MRFVTPGRAMVFISLLASVLLSLDTEASPQHFDTEAYRWAEGRTIDTVYVHGNTRVKTFAIVREMESRAGQRLDAHAVDRDQRYVGDLSPFATVAIHVEPIGDDHCALHVVVTERPTLLLQLVYPVLDYDINTQRLVYGVKWYDRNFRRRLEGFSLDANRDNRGNDAAAAAWSTSWFGWKHLGAGARLSYFKRRESASSTAIQEQFREQVSVALPLTESRISFSQLIFGMALADNRVGVANADARDENLISPSVGFAFDNRDGTIKPFHGVYFYVNVLTNHAFNRGGTNYYRVDNDVRWFHALNPYAVLAVHSAASIQLGDYPGYIRFGLGGPGTIRGWEQSDFRSAHRWVQSLELRLLPWSKHLYKLPFLGTTDFQLGMVAFVDTGIGWTSVSEFKYDAFHSGFGAGLRLFSPIQDVVRFDVGLNSRGTIRPYFATGVSF